MHSGLSGTGTKVSLLNSQLYISTRPFREFSSLRSNLINTRRCMIQP